MRYVTVVSSPAVCVAALLIAATSPAPAGSSHADHWFPFPSRRIVSESGQHYAILHAKKSFQPGPYELCARRAGAPPIEPAISERRLGPQPDLSIARDPDDTVVVAGTLPQLPMDAAVSDAPLGLVLFDQYGQVGYDQTLSFVDASGKQTWAVTLKDLFGGVPKGTEATISSLWWSRAWGLDTVRGTAWVLTKGGELREVALADGSISTPSAEVVAEWCVRESFPQRALMLQVAMSWPDDERHVFAATLAAVAADRKEPILLRIRAAIAARRAGATADWSELLTAATQVEDLGTALEAASDLPTFSGQDAVPALRAALLRMQDEDRAQFLIFCEHFDALVAAFRATGARGRRCLEDLASNAKLAPRVHSNARALLDALDR